jgi:hypothetical protein
MAYQEKVWEIDKREHLCFWANVTQNYHGLVCYFHTSIAG